jgi:hypothetical protein
MTDMKNTTSAQRGTVSMTGHSTNFVMYMDFLLSRPEKNWTAFVSWMTDMKNASNKK